MVVAKRDPVIMQVHTPHGEGGGHLDRIREGHEVVARAGW